MSDIRREVSAIIGYTIPKRSWKASFKKLDTEGRIVNKHFIQILALLLEREEARDEQRQASGGMES